jgi:hypothetical protein
LCYAALYTVSVWKETISSAEKSMPNGRKLSNANLKHCIPNGIPMIESMQITPVNSNSPENVQKAVAAATCIALASRNQSFSEREK